MMQANPNDPNDQRLQQFRQLPFWLQFLGLTVVALAVAACFFLLWCASVTYVVLAIKTAQVFGWL